MTQTNLALRIVSEALRNGGKCTRSRALHDGLAAKRCLFNTENEVGVANSMDKSGELTSSNGVAHNGPSSEIHQVAGVIESPMVSHTVNRQQNKQDLEVEVKTTEEISSESQGTESHGKFNETEYKKSQDEFCDLESNRTMLMTDEKMFLNQELSVLSMWKRPQVKPDKIGKTEFSYDIENLSPVVHPTVGLRSRGLLDSLKSGDLVQAFDKKRLSESRNFSTLQKGKSDGSDRLKPVPLILQREITSHCRNRITNNRIGAQLLSTSSKCYGDDSCLPPSLPPKDLKCDAKDKLPKCPKPDVPPWPCCPKICLCGCDPPHPRILLKNCGTDELTPLMSLAKRPEYICPSFSECYRRSTLIKKKLTECCVIKTTCDTFVGPRKPFVSAMERQELNLGQKYWTAQKQQCASFHRSARLMAEEECDKPGKNQLPCQRSFNIPGVRKKEYTGKGSCEKLCMPCCEPARVPPECLSIYQKEPCPKHKNPRPSFSECRKKFPFKHTMCECEVPNKPRCDTKKKGQESTC